MVQAIINGYPLKKSNTKVEQRNGETFVYLFENMIAHINKQEIFITNCGWFTQTTKERLNAILKIHGLYELSQKNFKWYLGDEEFQGNKIINL